MKIGAKATILAAATLLAPSSKSSDTAPPENVGVAAVEVSTGKVAWEAWAPEQVPEPHRHQARLLMGEWWDHLLPGPEPVSRRILIQSTIEKDEIRLEMKNDFMELEPQFVATLPTTRPVSTADCPSHNFVITDGKLYAFARRMPAPGGTWGPHWTHDLKPSVPQHWTIHPDHDLIWVASLDHFFLFRKNGEVIMDRPLNTERNFPGKLDPQAGAWIHDQHDLILVGSPIDIEAFDRANGEFRWTLPIKPGLPGRSPPYFLAREKGLIFFKSTHLDLPDIDPENRAVVAIDWKTGDIAWVAATEAEAPEEFQGFVSRELYRDEFVTKAFRPGRHYGPDSFSEKRDHLLSFELFRDSEKRKYPRKRDFVGLEGINYAVEPIKVWEETLNHLVVYSNDRMIRCFERKLPEGDATWGPKWEFDFRHHGVTIHPEKDRIWIVGAGRLVCLDFEGQLLKDFPAPRNLSFGSPMFSSYVRIRVDPDIIFLSGEDTAALDRETGRELWRYSNRFLHKFEVHVERTAVDDLVLIPTGGNPLFGISKLLGSPDRYLYENAPAWPNDDPEFSVAMAEMAFAYGDRATRMRLACGQYEKEGLSPEAIKKVDAIANREWPRARSKPALTRYCLAQLSKLTPPPDDPKRLKSKYPRLYYWSALLESPPPRDAKTRDLLAKACIGNLESGPNHENALTEMILTRQCQGSQFVDAAVIERVLVARGSRIQAAEWHKRHRGDYEAASKILLETPDSENQKLLPWFFYDPSREQRPGLIETRLLVDQLADQFSNTIRLVHPFFRQHPEWLPDSFVFLLREIVRLESKNPEPPRRDQNGYLLYPEFHPESLELLHLAGNPGDTPLFRKFLDHPLYRETDRFKAHLKNRKRLKVIIRDFNVRKIAAEILRQRGEPIPESLVTVEEIEEVY